MTHIARCNHEKCERKTECYRYMAQNYYELPLVNFANLCNDKNKYQYFYQIGDKPIRKLELTGGE